MRIHVIGAGRRPQALQRARMARLRHRSPRVPALRRRLGGHFAGEIPRGRSLAHVGVQPRALHVHCACIRVCVCIYVIFVPHACLPTAGRPAQAGRDHRELPRGGHHLPGRGQRLQRGLRRHGQGGACILHVHCMCTACACILHALLVYCMCCILLVYCMPCTHTTGIGTLHATHLHCTSGAWPPPDAHDHRGQRGAHVPSKYSICGLRPILAADKLHNI